MAWSMMYMIKVCRSNMSYKRAGDLRLATSDEVEMSCEQNHRGGTDSSYLVTAIETGQSLCFRAGGATGIICEDP